MAAELEPNQQYVLKMSSTSSSNKIQLPQWSGSKFRATITSYMQEDYNNHDLQVDSYDAYRTISILSPVVPPVVIPMGGGGGGFDNSPKDADNGVFLPKNSLRISKQASTNATSVWLAQIDADQLKKGLEMLKIKKQAQNMFSFELNSVDDGAKVEIPASALKDAIASKSNAVFSIQSDVGTYNVPILIFKDVASKLNADLKDVKITISINKASDKSYEMLKKANPSIKTLLDHPIEFTIIAETLSGSKLELNDFSGTYVERKIIAPNTLNANKTTAVSYDTVTGKMMFIPAVMTQVNGKSEVTIKSSHNSMYTLVELSKSFDDTNEHWAKNDIDLLASKFIVQGINESSFTPDEHVTRAQFASMLVSALGLIPDAKGTQFSDVKNEDWFAGSVGTAAKVGLVEGTANGQFESGQDITREQMAIMISRAINLAGKEVKSEAAQDKLSRFTDSGEISDWAKEAVAQTLRANIVNGLTEQSFAPKELATRGQATVMLKRFLQYVQFIN
ncbi:S-layer homology domain-containing protein [Paenibacillus sp. N3.4]|uniref:S-layer homology domain-containing protein n=1 Tax=Paenibacillus sp. N3.4 TaxID=2603222 RepID=UPI0011CB5220|nr:S-layer homology domain-containing protein [Paenibacillus sp. N3.4]TXK76352.1 S-layer homology domain-containing protein [Paenibacillus sp. N3.4]